MEIFLQIYEFRITELEISIYIDTFKLKQHTL